MATQTHTQKPLTAKQAAFVREYLKDWNATQAAIRAGYAAGSADVTGTRLLVNASISAAIAKARESLENSTIMSLKEKIEILSSIGRNSEEDSRARIAAINESCKIEGHYAPAKHEVTGANGGAIEVQQTHIDYSKLNDEEYEIFERLLDKCQAQ